MRAGFLSAALLSLSIANTSYASDHFYTIPKDRTGGGSVGVYFNIVDDLNRREIPVRITVPACTSACTFFLLADQVCVSERIIFEFHGPQEFLFSVLGLPIRNIPTKGGVDRIAISNTIMAVNYNKRWPGLGDWFLENAANKYSFGVVKVRGAALNKSFGVPICERIE